MKLLLILVTAFAVFLTLGIIEGIKELINGK